MKNILIVDDEEIIGNILSRAVSQIGHKPYTASNGAEAIGLFKKHPDIDIVILDLRMPEISGLNVCVSLKNLKPDIEIIISSAYVDETAEKELNELGVKHILRKPYPLTELQAIIGSIPKGI